MWSDNETTTDYLGFRVHADLIRAVVTDQTLLPITIGVFGDWGGGKTSIMRMLEHDLNPDNYTDETERKKYENIACLYFNGWLFEGYDDAKSAILSTILHQLAEHKRFGPKVREKVGSLLHSVDWMRLTKIGVTKLVIPAVSAHLTAGTSLWPALLGAGANMLHPKKTKKKSGDETDEDKDKKGEQSEWGKIIKKDRESSDPKDVRTFRGRFEEMLKECNIDSLVILIDDLDRCSPERIVDNLEAIKLFLNVEHTAFVVGADERIVRHAIATRYRRTEVQGDGKWAAEADKIIKDYLEKLIQIPYHLPKLSPSEVETYMSLLFCKRHIEDDPMLEAVLASCDTQRARNRYASFGYNAVKEAVEKAGGANVFQEKLAGSLTFTVAAAPLITEGLKGNPRQIKRFLNAYVLRKKLAEVAKLDHVKDAVLVKLMILEYAQPDEFKDLFDWQLKQDGFPKELKDLEHLLCAPDGSLDDEEAAKKIDPDWGVTAIRKWVAMEPRLADEDLRDYFWIARDRLDSTLSGLSLLPPIVRTLLDGLLSDVNARREAAVAGAVALNADERKALLSQLTLRILGTPDEDAGYDAFRALIERGVAGGAEALAVVLGQVPSGDIPPNVGIDLKMLVEAKPENAGALGPALAALSKTDTNVGRALTAT